MGANRKIILSHSPKGAGSTIRTVLSLGPPQFLLTNDYIYQSPGVYKDEFKLLEKFSRLMIVVQAHPDLKTRLSFTDDFNEYEDVVIGSVRHPYERVKSCFWEFAATEDISQFSDFLDVLLTFLPNDKDYLRAGNVEAEVLRFEYLAKDLVAFLRKYNIDLPEKIPHINKARVEKKEIILSDGDKQKIQKHFAWTFKQFPGYEI